MSNFKGLRSLRPSAWLHGSSFFMVFPEIIHEWLLFDGRCKGNPEALAPPSCMGFEARNWLTCKFYITVHRVSFFAKFHAFSPISLKLKLMRLPLAMPKLPMQMRDFQVRKTKCKGRCFNAHLVPKLHFRLI